LLGVVVLNVGAPLFDAFEKKAFVVLSFSLNEIPSIDVEESDGRQIGIEIDESVDNLHFIPFRRNQWPLL
jgi:hypothetical protein